MTDCKKHGIPLQARQIGRSEWKECCPICEYEQGEKLKQRVQMLWERLGMPVEGYEAGSITHG